MKYRYKIVAFCFSCLVLIGCDRATKDLAREHLKDQHAHSYFHDTIRLLYVENTGAFLSLGTEWPPAVTLWVFTILPALFLSAFFIVVLRKSRQITSFEMASLLLIFCGGIGNLIDRIVFDKHVADFLNLGVLNFRTGIFNIADVYVTTGVFLLLIKYIKKLFILRKAQDDSPSQGSG